MATDDTNSLGGPQICGGAVLGILLRGTQGKEPCGCGLCLCPYHTSPAGILLPPPSLLESHLGFPHQVMSKWEEADSVYSETPLNMHEKTKTNKNKSKAKQKRSCVSKTLPKTKLGWSFSVLSNCSCAHVFTVYRKLLCSVRLDIKTTPGNYG